MVFVTDVLMPVLATFLTGLAGWGLTTLINWLNLKIENEKIRKGLEEAGLVIEGAVATVSQTFVDELKKTGNFDDAAKSEAMSKALDIINEQLTTETMNIINLVTNDIPGWIMAQIEKQIRKDK